MQNYEKLGAFYLGREYDLAQGRLLDDLLLYDAKDLTTHAVCVGMTGSGKTGLCVSLLEEAAIDGIPAIAIDPKGDLGNLMLTFPKLRAEDFRPWVDPNEASRNGMTPDAYAADRAKLWKKGLKDWDQDGDRIERFRQAAEVAIYTPGSTAGIPLTVLRSFKAPPAELRADAEAMQDRITSAASGLLALLGIQADPIRSREHILLANILAQAWSAGRDLDLAALIGEIQSPPFDRIGVMDLESFFNGRDRFELAMTLNNLLASPGFGVWMSGEPLDIQRLLYTPEGRPRIAVLSIAHLSEAERMFFVTVLLNEVVAWMRTQSGTSSLRALLYMDEIFGFFPPTANPPSKRPMLTLLKQARAYGLGVVLATQNPVDLDYKGLSNTGTWFLGRLQTERDKQRVLEGLEGASATAGTDFNRAKTEAILAGLGSRVFMMNNVHDDEPVLFHTRWALSYLRGPLTRSQIRTLMAETKAAPAMPAAVPSAAAITAPTIAAGPAYTPAAFAASPATPVVANAAPAGRPPALASGVTQRFLPVAGPIPAGTRLVYRPALVGQGRLHYVRSSAGLDDWHDVTLYARLSEDSAFDPWEEAEPLANGAPDLLKRPDTPGAFGVLPDRAMKSSAYKRWEKAFKDHLYRHRAVTILKCRALKEHSGPNEPEGDFRIRLRGEVHERRDEAMEKLRKKYGPKLATLKDRIRKAEIRVEKESAQFKQAGLQTAVSLGATVLGALFGRKSTSVGTVGRAASTVGRAGRTAQQRGDISHARENMDALQEKLAELESEFEQELDAVREKHDADALEFEEIVVAPRKTDMAVRPMTLVWAPYRIGPDGYGEAAFGLV